MLSGDVGRDFPIHRPLPAGPTSSDVYRESAWPSSFQDWLSDATSRPDGTTVPVIDIEEMIVGDGEQVAMIGTSGSGKTTLLHLIAGILAVLDRGQIVFELDGGPGWISHG